jgi:hypothetical protein
MSNAELRIKNEEETHPITRMPLLGTLYFVQFEIHHSSIGVMRSILINTVFRLSAVGR